MSADADYLLAFVTPPAVEQAEKKPLPREVIFVIDNSGSMGGTSITQAKASLIYALGRLQPNDRFNVIRFDHTMDVLFPASVPADAAHISTRHVIRECAAGRWWHRNGAGDARGADRQQGERQFELLRQVVFLTDGDIGNEQQLFETITAMRGRSRVFMVGIGSAPNTYLMTRAAELGRGTFTHIGSVDEVEDRMRELFSKLENPAVTGLSAKFSDASADITPGGNSRSLSRRTAGARGEARQARGLARDQGSYRRPAMDGDLAGCESRRRQGHLEAVGAPQDQRR